MQSLDKVPDSVRPILEAIMALKGVQTTNAAGSGAFETIQRCQMEYVLNYQLRVASKFNSSAPQLGIAIHLGMEHYGARLMGQDLGPAEPFIANKITDFDFIDGGLAVMKEYEAQYHEVETRDWITLSCEHEYSATIGEMDPGGPMPEYDGMLRIAKLDRLAYCIPTNSIVIIDYKSEAGAWKAPWLYPWIDSGPYDLNLQAQMYTCIMQVVLEKTGWTGPIKYRIDRIRSSKPYVISRHPIVLAEEALLRTPRMLRYYAEQIAEAHEMQLQGVLPKQNFAVCRKRYDIAQRKYGDCAYTLLCAVRSRAERQDNLREYFTTVGHPRLTGFIE